MSTSLDPHAYSSTTSASMAESLLVWIAKFGGGLHPAVTITTQTDGRGFSLVLAKAPETITQADEQVIVSCPHIIAFSILQIPFVAPWLPVAWLDSVNETVLTRFMLVESVLEGERSVFHPYISMLPRPDARPPFRTPLYWTIEELATIRGTNLHEATVHRETEWNREFVEAKSHLLELRPHVRDYVARWSFELYKWAATVLSSRCFPSWMIEPQGDRGGKEEEIDKEFRKSRLWQRWISKDPTLRFPVLLPVFDLANHSPTAEVTWNAAETAVHLMQSMDKMQPGDEIFNNYGQKANEELLLGYGFDLPSNPTNSFLISLGLTYKMGKIHFIRRLASASLPSSNNNLSASLVLPHILNPATTIDDRMLFALRLDQHPLSSAAATPLSLMLLNTRELLLRHAHPFSTPIFNTARLPTHNGLETLARFAAVLHRDLQKMQRAEVGLPSKEAVSANINMQMGMRHRASQLAILESGIGALKKTLRAWGEAGTVLEINDLLTAVTPRLILKKFRQVVHRALGTRDADKIREEGQQEGVFVFWIVNLLAELGVDSDNDDLIDDTDPDVLNVVALRAWIERMKAAYGDFATEELPIDREEDQLCWPENDRDDAQEIADSYERRLRRSGLLDGVDGLRRKLDWAVRVVREECVWVPGWLDADDQDEGENDESMTEQKSARQGDRDGDDSDEEDEDKDSLLVWVLQEPKSVDDEE